MEANLYDGKQDGAFWNFELNNGARTSFKTGGYKMEQRTLDQKKERVRKVTSFSDPNVLRGLIFWGASGNKIVSLGDVTHSRLKEKTIELSET